MNNDLIYIYVIHKTQEMQPVQWAYKSPCNESLEMECVKQTVYHISYSNKYKHILT